MEYAREVLERYAKVEGRPKPRRKRFADHVGCAYCAGTGVDPRFGEESRCPVCGGGGDVEVHSFVVTCLRCRGFGRDSGELSCLACKGVGVVCVAEEATTCPKCQGTGDEGVFYCARCKGQGVA